MLVKHYNQKQQNKQAMTQKELGTNFTAFVCDCPAFKYEDWVVL